MPTKCSHNSFISIINSNWHRKMYVLRYAAAIRIKQGAVNHTNDPIFRYKDYVRRLYFSSLTQITRIILQLHRKKSSFFSLIKCLLLIFDFVVVLLNFSRCPTTFTNIFWLRHISQARPNDLRFAYASIILRVRSTEWKRLNPAIGNEFSGPCILIRLRRKMADLRFGRFYSAAQPSEWAETCSRPFATRSERFSSFCDSDTIREHRHEEFHSCHFLSKHKAKVARSKKWRG